jgi:hypothetical protein
MATEHLIILGRPLPEDIYYEDTLIEEMAEELSSNELVKASGAKPGDTLRIRDFPGDARGHYRNDGVYILGEEGKVWPLDYTLDEYGHVPENFYYPKYDLLHWSNVIDHNTLVPVKLSFLSLQDLELRRVLEVEGSLVSVVLVEKPEYILLWPLGEETYVPEQVLTRIKQLRHVEVVPPNEYDVVSPFLEYEYSRAAFDTKKPILIAIRPDFY